jgi:hypothetical protein
MSKALVQPTCSRTVVHAARLSPAHTRRAAQVDSATREYILGSKRTPSKCSRIPRVSTMASSAAATQPSSHDLLVVGPGVLGSYLGTLWVDKFGAGTVTGQTNTTSSHDRRALTRARRAPRRRPSGHACASAPSPCTNKRTHRPRARRRLVGLGIAPFTRESLDAGRRFPNVLYSAPPSGSADYAADVAAALQRWDGSGGFVFTSSAAVFDVGCDGDCNEAAPLAELGGNERTDRLLLAERVVLEAGGCVVRLVGLYHSGRCVAGAFGAASVV